MVVGSAVRRSACLHRIPLLHFKGYEHEAETATPKECETWLSSQDAHVFAGTAPGNERGRGQAHSFTPARCDGAVQCGALRKHHMLAPDASRSCLARRTMSPSHAHTRTTFRVLCTAVASRGWQVSPLLALPHTRKVLHPSLPLISAPKVGIL